MSRRAEIRLQFADGDYTFRLRIGELMELQENCDAGPPLVLARLQNAAWHVNDVRETVRLGLIGGGLSPGQAHKLVARYIDERPFAEYVLVAEAALAAALYGVEEEAAPKPGGETSAGLSPTENSDGPTGTAQASPPA